MGKSIERFLKKAIIMGAAVTIFGATGGFYFQNKIDNQKNNQITNNYKIGKDISVLSYIIGFSTTIIGAIKYVYKNQ